MRARAAASLRRYPEHREVRRDRVPSRLSMDRRHGGRGGRRAAAELAASGPPAATVHLRRPRGRRHAAPVVARARRERGSPGGVRHRRSRHREDLPRGRLPRGSAHGPVPRRSRAVHRAVRSSRTLPAAARCAGATGSRAGQRLGGVDSGALPAGSVAVAGRIPDGRSRRGWHHARTRGSSARRCSRSGGCGGSHRSRARGICTGAIRRRSTCSRTSRNGPNHVG